MEFEHWTTSGALLEVLKDLVSVKLRNLRQPSCHLTRIFYTIIGFKNRNDFTLKGLECSRKIRNVSYEELALLKLNEFTTDRNL